MNRVQHVDDLLKIYRANNKTTVNPKKVIFNGMDGYDVYNPTAPFEFDNKEIIIGRVEKRDSEHSTAIFFEKQEDGTYSKAKGFEEHTLQDPYITKIGEYFVFGGTEIFDHPEVENTLWWRAKFMIGKDIRKMEHLIYGPNGMKDIRLIDLENGKIGVFTRQQGEKGGRGKIGFTIINDIRELNEDVIDNAPMIEQFDDMEWGGVNEPTLLSNGKIGVLGHCAKYSVEPIRHYYPMVFCIDPNTLQYSDMKIIAERKDLLDGPSKRDDLVDVLFSAGIIRHGNGKATLYTGVSDVEIQSVEINDPFEEYEKL